VNSTEENIEYELYHNLIINGYRYNTGFIELLFNGKIYYRIPITPLGLEEVKEEKLLLITPQNKGVVKFNTIDEIINYLEKVKKEKGE